MNNRIIMPIFLVILLVFALLVGGTFPYFMLLIVTIIFLYSYISSGKIVKNLLGVYWSSNDVAEKGDLVELNYKIYNSGLLPIPYAVIMDGIPKRLSGNSFKEEVHFIGPFSSINLVRQIDCKHRGNYQLGNVTAKTGDIFGIAKKELVISDNISLTVYPKVYKLENFNITGKEFFGSASANQKYYEDYSSIKDIRKYEAGDSMKRVNWKVTAKKGELFVKNYDISANAEVQLFMDFQLDKYMYDDDELIEEKVIECTISIINYCLLNNIKIDFITYTDKKIHNHGRDSSRFKEFLELVARIRPTKNINLGDVIVSESRALSLGTSIVVVTPKIDKKAMFSAIKLINLGYSLTTIVVGDFIHNKEANNNLIFLEKIGVKVYKVDLTDNIVQVLR